MMLARIGHKCAPKTANHSQFTSLARRKAVSVSRLSCLITRLYAMSSEQTEHTSDTGRQSLSRN